MPDPVALPRVPTIRLIVIALLLTFSGATLVGSVIPARDGLHRTHRMLETQIEENEDLERRIDELDEEERALREDACVTQRILRDSYRILDEGEVTVILNPGGDDDATRPPADERDR